MPEPTLLLAAFGVINLWTFVLFGYDKLQAQGGEWRVKESTLLGFAFFGGSLGAVLGRSVFRHKTRKQPFSENLDAIIWFQGLAIAAGLGWWLA